MNQNQNLLFGLTLGLEDERVQWQLLPLHEDWDYKYTITLENVAYVIRMYYSERTSEWTMDITTERGVIVSQGMVIRSREALPIPSHKGLTGVFWLEPKARDVNQTFMHPSLINKYFSFYYGWGEVEVVEPERLLVRNQTSRVFHITSSLYPFVLEDSLSLGRNYLSYDLDEQNQIDTEADDEIKLSRSYIGYSIQDGSYRTVEEENSVFVGREFSSYEIIIRETYMADVDEAATLSRSLLSVTPAIVFIQYPYDEEKATLTRSLIDVQVTES